MQGNKYKIALVGYQLSGGGLEKSMSSLSIFFGAKGIEVHNIVFIDAVTYPYSGVLINIGKKQFGSQRFINSIRTFLFFRKYIQSNNFDYIIDFRYRINPLKEVLFSYFAYNLKTIYTVYSSKTETYLPKNKFLCWLITRNKYQIICNANEIKQIVLKKHDIKNCNVIYSAVDFEEINNLSIENIDIDVPYIIAAGRFDESNVKQFDKLIIAYSKSVLPNKGIHLVLLGDGILKESFIKLAHECGIKSLVHFIGFQKNPFKYFKNAIFLVLCSKYEGFGIVIIESLACYTPVVSLDCISGPKEIIIHKENGLLVENQNFEKLTEAMNLFIDDEKLYTHCKQNAQKSVEKFSIEKIGKQWLGLMKFDIN